MAIKKQEAPVKDSPKKTRGFDMAGGARPQDKPKSSDSKFFPVKAMKGKC